mmetsp:Transcript_20560/g.57108  ORF Transcript_20560/g.57108 Transcript_20560/m.57108 type:complete len:80 (-) Transcript_20560:105-344(-)
MKARQGDFTFLHRQWLHLAGFDLSQLLWGCCETFIFQFVAFSKLVPSRSFPMGLSSVMHPAYRADARACSGAQASWVAV